MRRTKPLTSDMALGEAAQSLLKRGLCTALGITWLPVVDKRGVYIGTFSFDDCAKAIATGCTNKTRLSKLAFPCNGLRVALTDSASDAIEQKNAGALVVVCDDNKYKGVV